MTTPITRHKRPPTTINCRATPFSVFKTLLWAEYAPREKVLKIIAGIMTFMWLTQLSWYLNRDMGSESGSSISLGMDSNLTCLALAGVVYSLLPHGVGGFTTRQPWQSLALPVRLPWLVMSGILFQCSVAGLLGTCWGLYRYFDGADAPFSYPLQLLFVLSAQGQTALLWCAATGLARGMLSVVSGLTVTTVGAILLGPVGPFSPDTNTALVLVLGAWIWIVFAVRALRGDSLPGVDLDTFPRTARLLCWFRARSAKKAPFASFFRAQLWFEWHRTARWFVAAIASAAVATLVIDVPYILTRGHSLFSNNMDDESDTFLSPYVYATLLIPLTFWFTHIAVTRSYRHFVFTRPLPIKSAACAKLLAAFCACAGTVAIERLTSWCQVALQSTAVETAIVPNQSSLWSHVVEPLFSVSTNFVLVTYGPLLFPIFSLLASATMPFSTLSDPTSTDSAHFFTSIFATMAAVATSAAMVLLFLLLVRPAIRNRFDFRDCPFPWEFIVGLIFYFVFVGIAIVEHYRGGSVGAFGLAYLGPIMLVGACALYGGRVNILCFRNQVLLLSLASVVSTVATWNEQSNAALELADLAFAPGYFLALAFGALVFYPVILGAQREEPIRRTDGKPPHWGWLLLIPIVWLALHMLGESLSEEEADIDA